MEFQIGEARAGWCLWMRRDGERGWRLEGVYFTRRAAERVRDAYLAARGA